MKYVQNGRIIHPPYFEEYVTSKLVKVACVGCVDNCLASIHVDFHTAVLLTASSGAVVGDRLM